MKLRLVAAGFCTLLPVFLFHLSCSAGTTEEIAALLLFIEQSDCTFIRNGKHYDALKARQHIEKKYAYYKEQVITAEDFIQYSATRSSITGETYKVVCDGVSIDSSDWLRTELENLRTKMSREDNNPPGSSPAN